MNLENLEGIPCPWCAIQGARVILPASGICPRCRPNYQPPSMWYRLRRAFADWRQERRLERGRKRAVRDFLGGGR